MTRPLPGTWRACGHPKTAENTYLSLSRRRLYEYCRECRKKRLKASADRKKLAALAPSFLRLAEKLRSGKL